MPRGVYPQEQRLAALEKARAAKKAMKSGSAKQFALWEVGNGIITGFGNEFLAFSSHAQAKKAAQTIATKNKRSVLVMQITAAYRPVAKVDP